MLADYHLHTKFCHHASGEMESYIHEAIAGGFEEIGFADHAPADEGFDPKHRMTHSQFPEYVDQVQKLRRSFPSFPIRLGIEVDLYPGFEKHLEKLRQEHPIEYVIGSVHLIEDFFVFTTDPVHLSKESERQLIHHYFDQIEAGVHSGLIDIVGHLDVIKWALPHAKEEIVALGRKVLETIAQKKVAIELNTSGLRKRPGEMYPHKELLQIAHALDIPVCLGSDAHKPQEVGSNFKKAKALLHELGYRGKGMTKGSLMTFLPG